MRIFPFTLLAIALTGCGNSTNDTAAGMQAFIEGCKSPVSGRITLSSNSWTGNNMEFTCAEFKPMATKAKP